jgi:hypothetical protein
MQPQKTTHGKTPLQLHCAGDAPVTASVQEDVTP